MLYILIHFSVNLAKFREFTLKTKLRHAVWTFVSLLYAIGFSQSVTYDGSFCLASVQDLGPGRNS